MSRTVYIGVGANQGTPDRTLRAAIAELAALDALEGLRVSRVRSTAPVGPLEQPDFLNAAVVAETQWEPEALLCLLHVLEARHGRRRSQEVHWGPRTLDLDLLMLGDLTVSTASVRLPHPELPHRRFVLEPLCDLAPDARHPVSGRTLQQLLEALAP